MADHLVEAALISGRQPDSDAGRAEGQANGTAAATTTNADATATAASAGAEVDFSTSLTTWREINLPSIQTYFETLCPKLVEGQREALVSRKRLAEQTREFKKAKRAVPGDADTAVAMASEEDEQREAKLKALLKAYQSEIDELTKRAKSAENAVLGVRDRLKDASDPYPILEAVVEQTATLADLETLRGQVTQLSLDNASLQTQLPAIEAERSRLQERIARLESGMESRATEQRGAIEAELSAKWDERWRNQVAREEDLTRALNVAQTQLRDLRQSHARATERLLEHGEDVERGETGGRLEELDMVSEELRRTTERLQSVERRNEQLREEMEKVKSGSADEAKLQEAEAKRIESEEEARRLTKLFEDESVRAKQGQEELERRAREAERVAKERERENEGLREKVRQMADYDEVKRELDIFKYVEFSAGAEEEDDDDVLSRGGGENGDDAQQRKEKATAKPLEALLIEKNKQLQDELATMRVSQGELSNASASTTKELEGLRSEVKRLKSLNERLEDDLVNMKPGDGKSKKTSSMSAEEALAEMDRIGGEASSSSSSSKQREVKNDPIPFETKPTPAASSSTNAGSSDSSILPIITGQRDRFRARNAELEEELRRQFETITELRNEVKTLQADNLSLYEKVRYLQAYSSTSNDAGASSSSVRNHYPDARIVNVSARNDVGAYPPAAPAPRTGLGRGEEKYRDKYEAAMNPFERFRGNEQNRALNSLNPLERVLHMLTRVVLGHRRMRLLFIAYAVCLHILVFAMLFELEFNFGGSTTTISADTALDPAAH